MQDTPISQGVSRLKELLFEPESQALGALSQRIDALSEADRRNYQDLLDRLARLAAADETGRVEIGQRLDALFERAGTDERFRTSVAGALDGALREAEVDRHQQLADAMAPLVVRTIKTEIRGSHDELAEALYPHMGRMVKAYIASAMKDLAEQINRRLETNPLMLRIRSITTGRPVAELAMAETMRVQVEELYLIRRGTGELVGRWPEATGAGNRDHVLGGTLSAINEFAAEAFHGEAANLRHVDLGSAQIYLRASPLYLLAAKCAGSAPVAIEQVIDDSFMGAIEQHREVVLADTSPQPQASLALLTGLAATMQERVTRRQQEIAVPPLGFAPLKWAAALILLPLIGWLAWTSYLDYMTGRTRRIAEATVAEIADLASYPTRVEVARGGGSMTLTGLAPTGAAKTAVASRLGEALPGVAIDERLVVLPNSSAEAGRLIAELKRSVSGLESSVTSVEREVGTVGRDVKEVAGAASGVRRDLTSIEADLSRAAVRRSLLRAASRLEQALPDLARLEGELRELADRASVRRVIVASEEMQGQLRARLAASSRREDGTAVEAMQPALVEWRRQLALSATGLSALIGQPQQSGRAPADATERSGQSPAELAEEVAAGVERLAAITVAVQQVNALRLSLRTPEPGPRERLASYVRDHAIFFANSNDYREDGVAEQTLDGLAALLKETDVLIRIVGYTDERGGQQRNTSLSQSRADKVLEGLAQRGVSRDRLVAVGRLNSIDLSPSSGTGSPNRRVEFEIGFAGERAP